LEIAAVQRFNPFKGSRKREPSTFFQNSRNVEMAILIPTWKLENFSSPANGFPTLYFDISFSVGSHHVVDVEHGPVVSVGTNYSGLPTESDRRLEE
jgi:hypothetical protein